MRVGIPRVLSFFYYYPFYKAFLDNLRCCETILSSPTSAASLEKLAICPTDEPCISIKLAFPHTAELIERGVDHVFMPTLISADRYSYYCPKHIGLPAMLRNGLDMPQEPDFILSPQIDWRNAPRQSAKGLTAVGVKLGASEETARRALEGAWRFQNLFERVTVANKLTYPETLERIVGLKKFQRKQPFSTTVNYKKNLRVGVVGHSYVVYDYVGHNVVDRLKEWAEVLVPEMLSREQIKDTLAAVQYGRELWSFEQFILGSALHWMKRGQVDCLVLMGPFECGPEAVIEVFLEEEAEKQGIPLLILTVDEQSGEAGLVTRLEAFLDTVAGATAEKSNLLTAVNFVADEREVNAAPTLPPLRIEKRVLGFPTLGRLGAALATAFRGDNVSIIGPLPITRRTADLGAELAPEFMCYPLSVTIGQMRECLEAGANTLIMVGGKGRCRLGWYAELQESLLRRAGYNFEMITINTPLPLQKNLRPFIKEIQSIFGRQSVEQLLRKALLAYQMAAAMEKAEEHLYYLRAWEHNRGEGDKVFSNFAASLQRVNAHSALKKAVARFREECAAIPLMDGLEPFRVRLIGEIYAVFESFANRNIAKTLGSLPDTRIQVETEITAVNWLKHNILHTPSAIKRHKTVTKAAKPYIADMVGGHGLDSVGLTALAPEEGVDGIVHLWPFTCMPEIIAQSILTRVAKELEIPVLTVIVNEQTGEAGLQTRIESFAHILRERRESALLK